MVENSATQQQQEKGADGPVDPPAETATRLSAEEAFGTPMELSQNQRHVLEIELPPAPTTVRIQPLKAVSWCSDEEYLHSVEVAWTNTTESGGGGTGQASQQRGSTTQGELL